MRRKGFSFRIESKDTHTSARTGVLSVNGKEVATPSFFPVATHAAIKGIPIKELEELGFEGILCNTFHLIRSPGESVIEKAGGLHSFMAWNGVIITDSGGFQVFSLPDKQVSESGVKFNVMGEEMFMGPVESLRAQETFGADIIMAFDCVVPYPSERREVKRAVKLTTKWLKEMIKLKRNRHQYLFGIVQGGTYKDLRRISAESVLRFDLPGYAIGGVSVGEGPELLREITEYTAGLLPYEKPRYLMGVGLPEDIVDCVAYGIDIFDCVIPTRYGRHGTLFTRRGPIRIKRRKYKRDFYPIDTSCDCEVCKRYSRAYIHHLFKTGEILGAYFGVYHNLYFYLRLMREIRDAIELGRYHEFRESFKAQYIHQASSAGEG